MASFDAGEKCTLDRELGIYLKGHKMKYDASNEAVRQIEDDCCSKCTEKCYKKRK